MNIETERLILRAMTTDEATAIMTNDRTVMSWAPDYPTPGDTMVATSALAGGHSFATEAMPWGLFTIVDKRSGNSIGGIGFKNSPNDRGEVEIGYGVSPSFQRRGVATEAVGAICNVARRGARVVLAETDSGNAASQRVLEKAGFATVHRDDETLRWRFVLARTEV